MKHFYLILLGMFMVNCQLDNQGDKQVEHKPVIKSLVITQDHFEISVKDTNKDVVRVEADVLTLGGAEVLYHKFNVTQTAVEETISVSFNGQLNEYLPVGIYKVTVTVFDSFENTAYLFDVNLTVL